MNDNDATDTTDTTDADTEGNLARPGRPRFAILTNSVPTRTTPKATSPSPDGPAVKIVTDADPDENDTEGNPQPTPDGPA